MIIKFYFSIISSISLLFIRALFCHRVHCLLFHFGLIGSSHKFKFLYVLIGEDLIHFLKVLIKDLKISLGLFL